MNALAPDEATWSKWLAILRSPTAPDILRDEAEVSLCVAYEHARLALRLKEEEIEALRQQRPHLRIVGGGTP